MKKKVLLVMVVMALGVLGHVVNGQDVQYRRSSLAMVLIESDNFPNKEFVSASWDHYPFPDKYNKHDIQTKSVNIEKMKLTDQDLVKAGFLKDTLRNVFQITKAKASQKGLKYLDGNRSIAVVQPTEKEIFQVKIDKMIAETHLANQVVASWFDMGVDHQFDMALVQERGFYNASELEAGVAKGQARGMSALGDAGEELIKNTFVTFTKLDFVENEPVARAVRDAAKKEITKRMSGKPKMLLTAALKGADVTYEKTKEGCSLWSKTFLYQLNWNDSTAMVFYRDYWNNPDVLMDSDLFKLNFVGVQYNQSLVTFSLGKKRAEDVIIDLALVRNLDNTFAKLQKKNDVFKPKVPIVSVNPIVAQIGEKESITSKSEFEVLEMVWNQKQGKTIWKSIGKCKVDKKRPVWDNRYSVDEQTKADSDLHGTVLKGSKKIAPGMLIRQIK
ncbi:hypothetical protein K5X82_05740 [Halosquirtibacter xylanolyticus]|uniref:hypothetical protein n=1 Tax=Halosquirtibacter xylanolyticus TaxID=3374599 RepID=UPI0037486B47|nr:hypothetical protein K5X82_05740 [Prolixibacteraceae bacterium]